MRYIILLPLMLIGSIYSAETESIDVGITMDKYASFGQNSVGLLEITLRIKNLNSKTIKYMTLDIDAYNRVGDLLVPYPGTNKCQITGPLFANKSHISNGCTSYYDSYVSSIRVRISRVEYLDGTINNTPSNYFSFNRAVQDDASQKMWIGVIIGLTLFSVIVQ